MLLSKLGILIILFLLYNKSINISNQDDIVDKGIR